MKGIVKFCDRKKVKPQRTLIQLKKLWNKTWRKKSFKKSKKRFLKMKKQQNEFSSIENWKVKRLNYLKHKPDTERNQKISETTTIQDTLKPIYASILKNNTNRASNSINQNTNRTGERQTLQQKLKSFTSKHSRSRSKSPTRKEQKTNQQNQSNEIAALKAELEELKQQK